MQAISLARVVAAVASGPQVHAGTVFYDAEAASVSGAERIPLILDDVVAHVGPTHQARHT